MRTVALSCGTGWMLSRLLVFDNVTRTEEYEHSKRGKEFAVLGRLHLDREPERERRAQAAECVYVSL